ncbi:imelysin family protein [Pseudoteredinibacter isoporae]|uniref:Putative iron-regulated protein n=1 Tax=Pseudoteredinibacter isoporae TaxID=570281 RepID=A0A7X0JWL9_9GAMM|nr:imelysin family protein [Pseudoteredinibacter isoporae]MBB6523584.1 putative iron-regulated protein [Pseudoteredinibacter isoporae]NHO89092.1 peptidase [Pseudoteredinibacter isoporae]NIB22297.1 peptidase [Pseudoteredinibacter isoporae]
MFFKSRCVVAFSVCAASLFSVQVSAEKVSVEAVVQHYTDLAHATFEDSLLTAQTLQKSIDEFLEKPSAEGLAAAKTAWKAARVPYQQSEVFRFGNPVVDDWEGQLNAWPLDEGLIDYVDQGSYQAELGNVGASANIIANSSLQIGANKLDIQQLTPELLASLNELGGSEANVATGYHAIEFLLWGQDLNGTDAGAGNRPYTDFVVGKGCTGGACERRREYLRATSQLLIDDLRYMVGQWDQKVADNYRAELLAMPAKRGLTRMLFGMGSLSLGELAGERLKVALEANSPEDEHDCFSDNTHYSHFYNGLGIRNIYTGEYLRSDGSRLNGPGIMALLKAKDETLAKQVLGSMDKSLESLQKLVDSAERKDSPEAFDQLIAEGNTRGEQMINQSINDLVAQTQQIENAAKFLGIDNLNPDNADHEF